MYSTFLGECSSLKKRSYLSQWGFKGILSTSCIIFSYPKLLSISVLTFIKWRLTPSYAAKDTIFWQKRPKTIVIRIIVWMTIFKSIHMAFYVNTSWACALFRNNKQHVVLGQKRNCQRVEESGLWRIQR
jgi:MFS superfamily sulfate permease-like transporter